MNPGRISHRRAAASNKEVFARIGNLDGRLVIVTDVGAIDVERASSALRQRFAAGPS